MKKAIWIINNTAGSARHGMVFRNYYLGQQLVKIGWDVKIISSTYNHQFVCLPPSAQELNYTLEGEVSYCWIKTRHYQGNGIGRVLAYWDFHRKLLHYADSLSFPKPDIVIASSPMPFLVVLGERLARRFGAKLIFEIRDLWPMTPIEIGGMSPRHPFILSLRWAERFGYQKADGVVAVMEKASKYINEEQEFDVPVRWIPNGFDCTSLVQEDILPDHVASYIDSKCFRVGYVGTLNLSNQLDVLIDAARLLNRLPIKFYLIGGGQEAKKLGKMAEGLSNVAFLGTLQKSQIASFIKRMDVCYAGLKPSPIYRYGASITKIFEYLYYSKPVIFSACVEGNIIEKSGAGFVVSSNSGPEMVADTVRACSLMPSTRLKEMGEKGKEFVLANHRYDKLAENYSNFLSEVLGNRSNTSSILIGNAQAIKQHQRE